MTKVKKLANPEIDHSAADSYHAWLESSAGLYFEQLLLIGTQTTALGRRREAKASRKKIHSCQEAGRILLSGLEAFEKSEQIVAQAKRSRARTILANVFPGMPEVLGERWPAVSEAIVSADMSNTPLKINSFVDHVEAEQALINLGSRRTRNGLVDFQVQTASERIKDLVEFWHSRTVQNWLRDSSAEFGIKTDEKQQLEAICHARNWNGPERFSAESAAATSESDSRLQLGRQALSLQ